MRATVLATIPWAPDGPLPRRLEPVDISSVYEPGLALERVAATRVRTLPDGVVCVVSAPDPGSGGSVAVRAGGAHRQKAVHFGPGDGEWPGWRLIDFIAAADGTWTLLELAPGPPDHVRARRIAPDGTTVWRSAAVAGSADALRQLLGTRGDAVLAVTDGGARLVELDAGGTVHDVLPLGAAADCFMNGHQRVGFVGFDPSTHTRSWVTLDAGSGRRRETGVDPGSAHALDIPLGMDGHDRPYGSRAGALVRFGADGRIDWELEVAQAIVDRGDVWVAQGAPSGEGLLVTSLSAPGTPAVLIEQAGRLTGRGPAGSFVLYERLDRDNAGTLATVAEDGSPVDTTAAPDDVWLQSFDLQMPRGPAVTDVGEIDLATRGPGALHLIRVTPG